MPTHPQKVRSSGHSSRAELSFSHRLCALRYVTVVDFREIELTIWQCPDFFRWYLTISMIRPWSWLTIWQRLRFFRWYVTILIRWLYARLTNGYNQCILRMYVILLDISGELNGRLTMSSLPQNVSCYLEHLPDVNLISDGCASAACMWPCWNCRADHSTIFAHL